MTDEFQEDDPVTEDENPRGLRRQLEAALAERREAEQRLTALERELAFAKAGLPLHEPRITYFVRGYEGPLDPEQIRKAAEEAGFLDTPQPAVPAEEIAAHAEMSNLAAGGQTTGFHGPVHENPQYQQEIRQARTRDEVLAIMDKYGSPRHEDLD